VKLRRALEGAYYGGDHFDLLEKRIFLFFCFLFFYFFYLGLFFEMIHEPLSLGEGTLAEDET